MCDVGSGYSSVRDLMSLAGPPFSAFEDDGACFGLLSLLQNAVAG